MQKNMTFGRLSFLFVSFLSLSFIPLLSTASLADETSPSVGADNRAYSLWEGVAPPREWNEPAGADSVGPAVSEEAGTWSPWKNSVSERLLTGVEFDSSRGSPSTGNAVADLGRTAGLSADARF